MEEAYWKQFMTTGRIEDYLQFKGVSSLEGKAQKEKESVENKGETPDAGFGKCNSHCT